MIRILHGFRVISLQLSQDIIRQVPALRLSADAHPDPGEILCPQVLDNGLQSVVSARAALQPDAELPLLEVDVVGDHNDLLRLHLVEIRGRPQTLPGIVHIGLGLQKDHPLPGENSLSAEREMLLFIYPDPHPVRQRVDHVEADVVARILILSPGIPEACNDVHDPFLSLL